MECDVIIERLVYGGNGIGRLDNGMAVFVPYVLPGENIRMIVKKAKKGMYVGHVKEILLASSNRIQPRCKHFGVCGGCHYQHINYETQLKLKQEIVQDQLERIGGIKDITVLPVIPSSLEWNYRNQVQFHVSRSGKLGFQQSGSHTVIPIAECHLLGDLIDSIWTRIDFIGDVGIQKVILRQGANNQVMLIFEGTSPVLPEFEVDFPLDVVFQSGEGEPMVLSGEDFFFEQILDRLFRVSSGAFFQVNTAQAENMILHVRKIIESLPRDIVMDVYCGVGLFSSFLAPMVKQLIGVESSEQACQDYAENLAAYDHVFLYQGTDEEVLPGLRDKIDGVILDPPRAGIGKLAMDAILQIQPKWIVYVSCDPATLARDLRRFITGGYQLVEVQPFDLFPQTYHIESISLLIRK